MQVIISISLSLVASLIFSNEHACQENEVTDHEFPYVTQNKQTSCKASATRVDVPLAAISWKTLSSSSWDFVKDATFDTAAYLERNSSPPVTISNWLAKSSIDIFDASSSSSSKTQVVPGTYFDPSASDPGGLFMPFAYSGPALQQNGKAAQNVISSPARS